MTSNHSSEDADGKELAAWTSAPKMFNVSGWSLSGDEQMINELYAHKRKQLEEEEFQKRKNEVFVRVCLVAYKSNFTPLARLLRKYWQLRRRVLAFSLPTRESN